MTDVRVGDERHRFTTPVGKESKTKQSFADECDINKIVARYRDQGIWDSLAKRTPTYGDFSGAEDLHTAMNITIAAQAEFDALPSAVRNLCQNNPENLLRGLADEDMTAELAEAGLPMAEDYLPPQHEQQKEVPEPPQEQGLPESSEGD